MLLCGKDPKVLKLLVMKMHKASTPEASRLPTGNPNFRKRRREPSFECVICHIRFTKPWNLQSHIKLVHKSTQEYQSLIEAKAKEAASRWLTPGLPEVSYYGIRLFKTGDGTQYQCFACDEILPLKTRILITSSMWASTSSSIPLTFSNKFLKEHVDLVHKVLSKPEPKKKFTCPTRLKPFAHASALNAHKWSHFSKEERAEAISCGDLKVKKHPNKLKCPNCPKMFRAEKELNVHQKFAHNPLKKKKEEFKTLNKNTFSNYNIIVTKVPVLDNQTLFKCSTCNDFIWSQKEMQNACWLWADFYCNACFFLEYYYVVNISGHIIFWLCSIYLVY